MVVGRDSIGIQGVQNVQGVQEVTVSEEGPRVFYIRKDLKKD